MLKKIPYNVCCGNTNIGGGELIGACIVFNNAVISFASCFPVDGVRVCLLVLD
jgi:hypothetical protein